VGAQRAGVGLVAAQVLGDRIGERRKGAETGVEASIGTGFELLEGPALDPAVEDLFNALRARAVAQSIEGKAGDPWSDGRVRGHGERGRILLRVLLPWTTAAAPGLSAKSPGP
jgi:hypothetical protein